MDFQAPLPPPPPPSNGMFSINHQPPLNLNANRNLSDRSQLLIDIEKGTNLKKISNAQKGTNSRPLHQVSFLQFLFIIVTLVSHRSICDSVWICENNHKFHFIEKNDLIHTQFFVLFTFYNVMLKLSDLFLLLNISYLSLFGVWLFLSKWMCCDAVF